MRRKTARSTALTVTSLPRGEVPKVWVQIEKAQDLERLQPLTAYELYEGLRKENRRFHPDLFVAALCFPMLGSFLACLVRQQPDLLRDDFLAVAVLALTGFLPIELAFAFKARPKPPRHLPNPVAHVLKVSGFFLAALCFEGALLIGGPMLAAFALGKAAGPGSYLPAAAALVAHITILYLAAYPVSPALAGRYEEELTTEVRFKVRRGLLSVLISAARAWQGTGGPALLVFRLSRTAATFLRRRMQDALALIELGWSRLCFAYGGVGAVALSGAVWLRGPGSQLEMHLVVAAAAVTGLLLAMAQSWIEHQQDLADHIGLGLGRCLLRTGRDGAARYRVNEVLDSPRIRPQEWHHAIAWVLFEEKRVDAQKDVRPSLHWHLSQATLFSTAVESASVALTRSLAGLEDAVSPISSKWPDVLHELMSGDWGEMAEGAAHFLVRDGAAGGPERDRVRSQLLLLMREPQKPAWKRVIAGDALGMIGDPRFRESLWWLPDEPLVGFVRIPAGVFLMGEGEQLREVELPEYFISRFPVTAAQFRSFLKDGSHDAVFEPKGIDNHAADWIAYRDARAYCSWLQERLRRAKPPEGMASDDAKLFWPGLHEGRLTLDVPSEAEWEKAARGVDGRSFPWGDKADPERANCWNAGIRSPTSVGCFPQGASVWGVEDLIGNVQEWTRGGRGEDRLAASVLRGGDFSTPIMLATCASRRPSSIGLGSKETRGFRVAASPSGVVGAVAGA